MKSKISAIILALCLISFLPVDLFGKGGGGGGGGGGRSFGGGGGRIGGGGGFGGRNSTQSIPRTTSIPRTLSPAPAPEKFNPKAALPPKPKTDFDSAARQAQQKQESKKAFDAAKAERARTEAPKTDYKDRRVQDLKRELNYQKMENRELRQRQTFGAYYDRQPVVVYHDGISNAFWYWLILSQSQRNRDEWVYNHRDSIDPARYEELKRQDRDLEDRIKALEAQGVVKDPTYTPQGVDKDLVYSDEHVAKVYKETNTSNFPWLWVGLAVLAGGVIYLFFFVPMVRRN